MINVNVKFKEFEKSLDMNVSPYLQKQFSKASLTDLDKFRLIIDQFERVEDRDSKHPAKLYKQIDLESNNTLSIGTIEHFERQGFYKKSIFRVCLHGAKSYRGFKWEEI